MSYDKSHQELQLLCCYSRGVKGMKFLVIMKLGRRK